MGVGESTEADPVPIPLESLAAQITELSGHLAAAECAWLLLVAEYDRRGGHEEWGCRTCAHWLSWHCGVEMRAAREKVRVGRALEELPLITTEFAAGRLSYSKVRALTRVATPANESGLVMLAQHATAVQVERIVRAFRRARSVDDELNDTNTRHASRYFRCDWDADGSLVVHGRIPPEMGAIVLLALETARTAIPPEPTPEPDGSGGPAGPRDTAATNADALVMMAESLVAGRTDARTGGDRYQININVDADVITHNSEHGVAEIDGGPALAPETVRRLGCDASVVLMLRNDTGAPINVSSKSRTIPPALRRAVHARDQGCRFPGCGSRRFIDVHHVRHRAHGGTNTLDNVVELCWFHHRLVHEGGWGLRFDSERAIVAITPGGNVLARSRPPITTATLEALVAGNHDHGAEIDPNTCLPRWDGRPLDLDLALAALCGVDERAQSLTAEPGSPSGRRDRTARRRQGAPGASHGARGSRRRRSAGTRGCPRRRRSSPPTGTGTGIRASSRARRSR